MNIKRFVSTYILLLSAWVLLDGQYSDVMTHARVFNTASLLAVVFVPVWIIVSFFVWLFRVASPSHIGVDSPLDNVKQSESTQARDWLKEGMLADSEVAAKVRKLLDVAVDLPSRSQVMIAISRLSDEDVASLQQIAVGARESVLVLSSKREDPVSFVPALRIGAEDIPERWRSRRD